MMSSCGSYVSNQGHLGFFLHVMWPAEQGRRVVVAGQHILVTLYYCCGSENAWHYQRSGGENIICRKGMSLPFLSPIKIIPTRNARKALGS